MECPQIDGGEPVMATLATSTDRTAQRVIADLIAESAEAEQRWRNELDRLAKELANVRTAGARAASAAVRWYQVYVAAFGQHPADDVRDLLRAIDSAAVWCTEADPAELAGRRQAGP